MSDELNMSSVTADPAPETAGKRAAPEEKPPKTPGKRAGLIIGIAAAVLVVQVLMNLKVIPALWVLKRGKWVRNITVEGSQV